MGPVLLPAGARLAARVSFRPFPRPWMQATFHKWSDFAVDKTLLAILAFLVKVMLTMKRIFTLVVLLGLVMGAVLTGCDKGADSSKVPDTNAAPAVPAAPSTNK
jgi:hypothetical protein